MSSRKKAARMERRHQHNQQTQARDRRAPGPAVGGLQSVAAAARNQGAALNRLAAASRELTSSIDLGKVREQLEEQAAQLAAERRREMEEAPVFSEPVIGYRAWTIDAFRRLRSLTAAQWWSPGVNVAECAPPPMMFGGFQIVSSASAMFGGHAPAKGHAVPHADCDCGLYAWNDISRFREQPAFPYDESDAEATPVVIGSISAWGGLLVHRDGFRAERACVTALAIKADYTPLMTELVQAVAERYRVRAVSASQLEEEASRHGTPLPDWMRPDKPPRETLFDPGLIYLQSQGPTVSIISTATS